MDIAKEYVIWLIFLLVIDISFIVHFGPKIYFCNF
jgi:hypothetical protein